jgi:hypothetical protein
MPTLRDRVPKNCVARFAGSVDLKTMVTQDSPSLALGLAMTAASQLDYWFVRIARLFGQSLAESSSSKTSTGSYDYDLLRFVLLPTTSTKHPKTDTLNPTPYTLPLLCFPLRTL